ncbi:non-heme iron oxygenase ferredoxin subunit [Ramlibacter sp. PS3R-8]|uniref:non-heme iron oxygenase ferredoxin subunit n=1 Tax=Ramlibacter sp. PS3R-8 TaxID=3133437 RepID=UPI0030B6D32A
MSAELHHLCRLDELEEGTITGGRLPDGHRVAIYLIDGEVYVTDDRCSHGAASLTEEGIIDGCQVECSWHFGRFDIRSGAPTASPCTEAIRTYRVTVQDGAVHVVVSDALRIASASGPVDDS